MIILNNLIGLSIGFLVFLVCALLLTIGAMSDRIKKLLSTIELHQATSKADLAILASKQESIFSLSRQIEDLKDSLAETKDIEHEKACLFIAREAERIRADAISKSKQVQKGFSAEHFAPFQMEFNPRDYQHQGNPIDYLVYVGSTDIKDGTADRIEEIIFLDIKTGQADLNKTQRRIRDAIVEGRVHFATWNPDTNTLRRYTNEP